MNMKTIAIILFNLLFIVSVISAQENKEADKVKEEKTDKKDKKKKAKPVSAEYRRVEMMVDSMAFVLEADYLRDQYGNRVVVSSGINFIMVDSMQTVLQTGNNYNVGANGVGGVTADGRITRWKVNKNEKREYITITMDVMTNIGIYNVFIDISSSERANATLSGLWPGRLIWEGRIVPLAQSRVYKGRSY